MSGMADEAENSRLMTIISDFEARFAALEKRLSELETQRRGPVDDNANRAHARAIEAQSERLVQLEKRHDNLLRYTPEARETPNWLAIAVVIIAAIFVFARYRYHG